jgi:hypothetical protein
MSIKSLTYSFQTRYLLDVPEFYVYSHFEPLRSLDWMKPCCFASREVVETGWVTARRFNEHFQISQFLEDNPCRAMVNYVSLAVSSSQ